MKQLRSVLAILVVVVYVVAMPRLVLASPSTPLIGTIEKSEHLVDGCSCTLFDRPNWNPRDGRVIFISEIGGENAWMNVSGSTESLKLFFLREPDRPLRKGDRLRRNYWSSVTHVMCDVTVTNVCDGKSECDGFGVSATISVVHRTRRAQIRGYGVCGC